MHKRLPLHTALGVALLAALLLAMAPTAMAAPRGQTKAVATADSPVDLNAATVDELTKIPGIGRVTAERIVQWREQHGPFRRPEDLMKVKGIGDKSFDKLRPYVKVGKSH